MIETHRRLGFAEPIPIPTADQVERAAAIVVSANEPVFGRYRYRDLVGKVSYVFYELVKQHVFFNGNKRIATFFLLYLLEVHGYMLETDAVALAEFAREVAQSDPAQRQKVLKRIKTRIARDTATIEDWKGFDPW